MKKRYSALPFLIIAAILTWPTIDTRRLLPIFAVVTLPFLADFLKNIKVSLAKYKVENILVIVVLIMALQFNLYNRFASYNLYNFTEQNFCDFASNCSVKATNYLISHPPKGKGFNFYDWGGYLIGKNIPAKLFIDGRMHLWGHNDYSPFGDYISIYYDKNYNKFKQYNFDWVFVQADSSLSEELANGTLGNWKLEFKDGNSAYFVRLK